MSSQFLNESSSSPKLTKILLKKLAIFFGFDLRSLALFRIGLAVILIGDIVERFSDLQAHYTDIGILPRGALIEKFLNPSFWSIHFWSGEYIFQAILFFLAFIFAWGLLIGYRTQLMTFLSWLLLVSVHNRNPMILNGGDIEFHLLFFWSIFLPLGAYYSVDRALNSSEKNIPKDYFSGATMALTFQVCFVYWFAVVFKSDPIWWQEGSAVYYALSIDQMATPLGQFLLNYPLLLKPINFFTLWFELLGPFLLFVPIYTSWFRLGAVIFFIGLHIGFASGLVLGIFPYVCVVSWLVFLPDVFWQKISDRFKNKAREQVKIYYHCEQERAKKIVYLLATFLLLPKQSIFAETLEDNRWLLVENSQRQYGNLQALIYLCRLSIFSKPIGLFWEIFPGKNIFSPYKNLVTKSLDFCQFRPWQLKNSFATNIIALFLLICITWWNFSTIAPQQFSLPSFMNWLCLVLRLDQKWDMFSPFPLKDDGWYVIPGKLKDGSEINLFQQGKSVSWSKPEQVATTYSNDRWRKYMMNIWYRDNSNYRLYYGQYLCRNWNTQHQGNRQLETFQIFYMLETTLPNYQKPKIEKISLWQHNCFK